MPDPFKSEKVRDHENHIGVADPLQWMHEYHITLGTHTGCKTLFGKVYDANGEPTSEE
jgi:hypothetical protein